MILKKPFDSVEVLQLANALTRKWGLTQQARLKLDTLEATLKGGEDGPAVVPGDSAKSQLVADVAHAGDEDDFMPPPKNRGHIGPLTKEQIGLIRAWIDQGAKP